MSLVPIHLNSYCAILFGIHLYSHLHKKTSLEVKLLQKFFWQVKPLQMHIETATLKPRELDITPNVMFLIIQGLDMAIELLQFTDTPLLQWSKDAKELFVTLVTDDLDTYYPDAGRIDE